MTCKVVYQEMAKTLVDYSFIGDNQIFCIGSGLYMAQHEGRLLSVATQAISTLPLSFSCRASLSVVINTA